MVLDTYRGTYSGESREMEGRKEKGETRPPKSGGCNEHKKSKRGKQGKDGREMKHGQQEGGNWVPTCSTTE